MAAQATIPRFLLPLQSSLWRTARVPRSSQTLAVRYASSSSSSSDPPNKPIVLEKPARFNPPSHGSRLKRSNVPRHYGPDLTATERVQQGRKHYPGLMAPEGSWAHWFWTSRILHTFITMGVLFALGIATLFMNYAYNSPFKDLLPPVSDLWTHPLYFTQGWWNVILMHEKAKGAAAAEHRTQHLNDVAKRRYFMKMHGIEPKDPIATLFGSDDKTETVAELEAKALDLPMPEGAQEKPARKKWFGIF